MPLPTSATVWSRPRRPCRRAGPAAAGAPSPGRRRGCRRSRPRASAFSSSTSTVEAGLVPRPSATASAKRRRAQVVRRGVDPVAGAGDRARPPRARPARLARPASLGVGHEHRRRGRPGPAAVGRLGLVAGEAVRAEQRALGDRARSVPRRRRRRQRQRQRDRRGRPARGPRRRRPGAASPRRAPRRPAPRPSPTATTTGAATAPSVASLVTSPAAPVAPSSASVAASLPSNAAATLSAPGASSGAAAVGVRLCDADDDRVDGELGRVGVGRGAASVTRWLRRRSRVLRC